MKRINRDRSRSFGRDRDNNQTRSNRNFSSRNQARPTENYSPLRGSEKGASEQNSLRGSSSQQIIDNLKNLSPTEKKLRQKETRLKVEYMRAVNYLKREGKPVTPENIEITIKQNKRQAKSRNLSDSDVDSYIFQSGTVSEGEGIVSGKLKALGSTIFFFLIILLLIGNFLNENNPLVPLFKSIKENFVITILDNRGATILEARKNNENVLGNGEINNNIMYSFTALHTLLEILDMKKKKQRLHDSDINPAFVHKAVNEYKSYLINKQLNKLPEAKKGLFKSTIDFASSPLKEKEACKIFTSPETMGNEGCEYSYVNFILHKLYNPNSKTFFDLLSKPFKEYLLSNWLRNSVSLNKFLYVFLNITYYGNYQIGFKGSYLSYFDNKLMDDIDLPESIFLIHKLYVNNKSYYPNYPISQTDLIDMLYAVRYIPNKIVPTKSKKPKSKKEKPKKYIDYIKEQVLKIDEQTRYKNNSPFGLYINKIFFQGFANFPEELSVKIKTTFSMKLQNIFIRSLRLAIIGAPKPPNAAAMYVLQNGKILAASSFMIKKGKVIYLSSTPKVHAYNTLKPFLYLSLIENKKDIPPLLLKYQYQNLIFSNKRIEFAKNQGNKKNIDPNNNTKANTKSLEVLSNTNIDNIPAGLKKSLAEQLDLYEYNLFNVLNTNQFSKTLSKFDLLPSNFTNYKDVYNGKTTVTLFNLVKAYSVFPNSGELRGPQYIEFINKDREYAAQKTLRIKDNYLNLLKDLSLNKVYNNNGTQFFVIFDLNIAIIFNKKYSVGLWLGNNSKHYKASDYSEVLAEIVPEVINELP